MRIFKKIGFLFFLVLLLLLLLVGFEFFSHKLSFEQLSYIRTNYTTEEIVYFYETVFFSDDFYKIDKYKSKNGSSFFISNTKIKKWEKDLYVKPFGDFTNQNILSLKKAIDYLNSIELPVRLFYTEGESYNVRFFFGSKSFIRKETNYEFEDESDGFAKIYTNFSSTIDRAFIGIDNTLSPDYHRPDIILEELTQTLGILGDSYSHPNSLFYEGSRNRSPLNKLTYLDERILKLLYSENIKAGVSRKNFLKSFKDIIKISDGLIKEDFKNFEEFISLNQFSEETIRMFLNTAFSNGNQYVPEPHIQKWRNEINCRLENNISSKDSLAIVKLFEQLKIIPSFPKINLQTKNKNGNMMIGYCDGLMCDNH